MTILLQNHRRKIGIPVALATAALVASGSSIAYPTDVHSVISEHAVRASHFHREDARDLLWLGSGLDDQWFLLPQSIHLFVPEQEFDLHFTPMQLMQEGSVSEDKAPRFMNHFFDPQNGGRGLIWFDLERNSSPNWVFERDGIENQYSYWRAKTYYSLALSLPTKYERDVMLAEMFYVLGHVIHHIQDMAQPQHTRNDSHPPLWGRNAYEVWSRKVMRQRRLPFSGYDVDPDMFSSAYEFWTIPVVGDDGLVIGGRGIADFSSFNFISRGTNFSATLEAVETHPDYDAPVPAAVPLNAVDIEELLGPWSPFTQPLRGEIWFVPTLVNDELDSNFSSTNTRASSYSIFSNELRGTTPFRRNIFSMNSFNYEAAAEFLVPRAVAYSAALIDHFFRGRLDVALPESGAYAVLDHAVTNSPTDGFSRLTARVRNASQDAIGQGEMRAIVKYFRNPCYEPDLLGEWREGGFGFDTWNGCEESYGQVVDSGEEGMVVSQIIEVQSISTSFSEYEFVFSQPIPVDAYDLRLQVVFEGKLGEEEGTIAIGAVNISEPTFFGIQNATDFFAIDGEYYSPNDIASNQELLERVEGMNYQPEPFIQVQYRIGDAVIAGSDRLEPRSFHRIGVLIDDGAMLSVNVSGLVDGFGGFIDRTFAVPATRNQFERDPIFGDVTYTTDTRGAISHFMLGFHKGIGVPPSRESFLALPPIVDGCFPDEGCAATPSPVMLP